MNDLFETLDKGAHGGGMNQRLPDNETKFAKILILLAWEAGELSQAQAVAALQMPTLQARGLRQEMIETGVKLHEILTRQERTEAG